MLIVLDELFELFERDRGGRGKQSRRGVLSRLFGSGDDDAEAARSRRQYDDDDDDGLAYRGSQGARDGSRRRRDDFDFNDD